MGTPRALRFYVAFLGSASLCLVAEAVRSLGVPLNVWVLVAFLLAYVATECFQFALPSGSALSLGSAVALAAISWLGPAEAKLIVAAAVPVVGLLMRTPFASLAFNFSAFLVSVSGAGLAYQLTGGVAGMPFARLGVPLVAAGVVMCLAQLVLMAVALSLYKGRPLSQTVEDLGGVELVLALVGVAYSLPLLAAIVAYRELPALGATAAVSVALSTALKRYARRSQGLLMGRLIPSPTSEDGAPGPAPSGELVELVSALAAAAGLGVEEADALGWAALLHDREPTEGAREVAAGAEPGAVELARHVREHPLRAAVRVGQVGNLLWVARILETHHEQHNGWGYPFGLKGEEIPLPAALLGVAEAYLALIAARPHGDGTRSPLQALQHLRARAGEQFSPRAVAALEQVVTSGVLNPSGESGTLFAAAEAVVRLRRASAEPRLARPARGGRSGSDLWLYGTGGVGRLFRRLFASNPFSVPEGSGKTVDWYRSLYELGRVFGSTLDAQAIAGSLAEVVHNLTALPCEVSLIEDDGEALRTSAVCGLPPEVLSGLRRTATHGLLGVALAESRPVISLDVTADPRVECGQAAAAEIGLKSVVVVPLAVAGTALGGVWVYSPTVVRFAPSVVEAVSALANLAALALHNASLYRKASDRLDQLDQAHRFLRTVLDTVHVGILALAGDGGLSLANREASRCLADLGLDGAPGEPRKRDLIAGLEERLGSTVARSAQETLEPRGPETVTAKLPGGERCLRVWAAPVGALPGTRPGVLVVLDDVTQSKRLEAEVRRTEKLAAMGEVAAKAAHEIRNPLASILGFLQLLELYCPAREQWGECRDYVDRAANEIGRLEEIAGSMLDLARPSQPCFVRGDLTQSVREVISLLSGKASSQGVAVLGPPDKLEVVTEFDPRQMRQVLINLAQNALDAVSGPGGPPPGQRKVVATARLLNRGGRAWACVQVRDNGPGVPGDDRTRVFAPFFTTKETGTGLGLPVCKGIVEAHGGTVRVRNGRGGGAVFEVLLPTRGAPEAQSGADSTLPQAEP